jgi:hypothetical protein
MHESKLGITPEAQAQYVPDDRRNAYRKLGDVLKHVAEKCGVTVDETTHTRWQQAGSLMREFDTFADERPLGKDVDSMAVFRDFSFFAPRYPALTREAAGPEIFDQMVENVATILNIGRAIAKTTDNDEYIELRKAEAYYTTSAFTDLATPEVQEQAEYNEFKWRVTGLSITANLGDSVADLRRDYKKDKTRVRPSRKLYGDLIYDMAKHGKPHIPYVLDREGARLRAQMIGERISNRARGILRGEGIPEYSNLRLIFPKKNKRRAA